MKQMPEEGRSERINKLVLRFGEVITEDYLEKYGKEYYLMDEILEATAWFAVAIISNGVNPVNRPHAIEYFRSHFDSRMREDSIFEDEEK